MTLWLVLLIFVTGVALHYEVAQGQRATPTPIQGYPPFCLTPEPTYPGELD